MLGTDQYRHLSIETSNEPRMGKGSISISQTMHQGYRYQSVLCVQTGHAGSQWDLCTFGDQ